MSGFHLKLQTETVGGVDKSWIRTRMGLDTMLPIMVDISAFNANHVKNGNIPSGTCLGKITATGFYGPYIQGAGTGTGAEVMAGHLFEDVGVQDDVVATAPDVASALFWTGVVKESRLPAFAGTTDGEIDANGKADVAAHIRYV